jgi:predicted short-subunit dehydrogenase-like oxidoreductase (DUF2520 family)
VAPSLNLIGAGHVGRTLGRLFHASGAFTVQDILTRSEASAIDAASFIRAGRAVSAIGQLQPADALMLAVGDDQIEGAVAALAAQIPLDGVLVFHCSGAKSSAALALAQAHGALVASAHPIRSFADPATVAASFDGTWCGVEGDARALALLEPALGAIGARSVRIDAAAKTVYHAASVFASNYVVTVLDAALRAYQAAGVPAEVAFQLARPLATETMANVFRLGPEKALSGPIARGDFATVARQQQSLDGWDGPTGALYAALVEATKELAKRRS